MASVVSEKLVLRLLSSLLDPYVTDLSRDKLHGVGMNG